MIRKRVLLIDIYSSPKHIYVLSDGGLAQCPFICAHVSNLRIHFVLQSIESRPSAHTFPPATRSLCTMFIRFSRQRIPYPNLTRYRKQPKSKKHFPTVAHAIPNEQHEWHISAWFPTKASRLFVTFCITSQSPSTPPTPIQSPSPIH